MWLTPLHTSVVCRRGFVARTSSQGSGYVPSARPLQNAPVRGLDPDVEACAASYDALKKSIQTLGLRELFPRHWVSGEGVRDGSPIVDSARTFRVMQFNVLAEGLSSGPTDTPPFPDKAVQRSDYGGFDAVQKPELVCGWEMDGRVGGNRVGEKDIWRTARTARGGTGHLGRTETQRGRLWTACGQRCVVSKNSQTTPATTSTSSIRQLLGTADTQTAHHAAFSTVPTHQLLGSANAETTPARAPAAAAERKQRPDATCGGKNG